MLCLVTDDVKWFENYNLTEVETPVDTQVYERLLIEAGFDEKQTRYLTEGFSKGFKLNFNGNRNVKRLAPNLKLTIGTETDLWNKVMTEVEAGRYAGPFEEPPFEHFIQSPIGLVPKDKGKKTRLIFHLSYPRDGLSESVNQGIDHDDCTVKYPMFDDAVRMCMREGRNCFAAKSDMSRAFRNVPLAVTEFSIMLMKAKHPITGIIYYFVDKCLPFGSSISCKIFQDFSDSIAHIVQYKTGKSLLNYLDDYFFAALRKIVCDWQVQQFLDVCEEIRFPVSMEKTEWGSTVIIFLGMMLNTVTQTISIPQDKVEKALEQIYFLLNRDHKKTTVHKAQQLCGLLNFLCKCIVPGRAFVTRLYSLAGNSAMKPHHHVRITEEHRLDLSVWKFFLEQPKIFCRPFMDFDKTFSAEEINMYSDAAGNYQLGFGALCDKDWLVSKWDPVFMEIHKPSIQFLELYALTAGVLTWIKRFKNSKVRLFCDNDSVKRMINNSSSKCKKCMVLIRLITLESLIHNVRVYAKHVSSKDNTLADALSRMDFETFRNEGKHMSKYPTPVPKELIPMEKVWFD